MNRLIALSYAFVRIFTIVSNSVLPGLKRSITLVSKKVSTVHTVQLRTKKKYSQALGILIDEANLLVMSAAMLA